MTSILSRKLGEEKHTGVFKELLSSCWSAPNSCPAMKLSLMETVVSVFYGSRSTGVLPVLVMLMTQSLCLRKVSANSI